MGQKDRHATARFLGMHTPVEIRTPEVPPRFASDERAEEYRLEQLAKLPFVLSCDEAKARLEKRHSALALSTITPETEPRSYKRRVPSRATMKEHVGSKDDTGGVELQERDLAVLQGLFESRLMTLTHITRLYFNGHAEAAKKRVQRLKEDRYVRERARRVYQPSILHLSRRAFATLSERGMLFEYPQFAWNQLEDRANVSELTLKHELQVLDVKTAFSCAIGSTEHYELIEFSTWPLLYQFEAAQPALPGAYQSARVLIKPDGFVRLHEQAPEGDLFEHFLFLEVDRSTESRETLARRAFGYQDFYRQGGLAVRYGAARCAAGSGRIECLA